MSEEEIGEEILQRLKLDGIVNSEEDVWRAMDTEMESESHVIPVKLKKTERFLQHLRHSQKQLFLMSEHLQQKRLRSLAMEC